jgi:hypothetical protein
MLRGVADAQAVARQVTQAWMAATGGATQAGLAPTTTAANAPSAAHTAAAPQWIASPT